MDPIRALVWSAVVNGVIVVPIMVAMMIVASRRAIMGNFVAAPWQVVLGWAATAVMAAAGLAMFATM
jgi:Mn2+/Fe2+ NRAMP family transporter